MRDDLIENPKISIISLSIIILVIVTIIIGIKIAKRVPETSIITARKWAEYQRKKGHINSYLKDLLKLHGWKESQIKRILKR